MDYNKAFWPKSRLFFVVLLLQNERCYEAEICAILLLLRCPFHWHRLISMDSMNFYALVNVHVVCIALMYIHTTGLVAATPALGLRAGPSADAMATRFRLRGSRTAQSDHTHLQNKTGDTTTKQINTNTHPANLLATSAPHHPPPPPVHTHTHTFL